MMMNLMLIESCDPLGRKVLYKLTISAGPITSHKLLEWAVGTLGLGSPDPRFGAHGLWNGVCCRPGTTRLV